MADYYPLLARAVAALPESTPDARRSIYERARKALLGQLRRVEPPVPEEDIERENKALDAAIARLESELGGAARQTEEPTPAPIPPPAPAAPPAPASPAPAVQTTPAPSKPAASPPPASAAAPAAPRTAARPEAPAVPPASPRAGSLGARSAPRAPQTPPAPAPGVTDAPGAAKPGVPPRVEPAPPAERPVARPSLTSNIARERIWPPPSRAGGTASDEAPAPPGAPKSATPPAASGAAAPPIVANTPVAPSRPVLPIVEPKAPEAVGTESAPVPMPQAEEERPRAKQKAAGPLSRLRLFARPRERDKAASFEDVLGTESADTSAVPPIREAPASEPLRPIAPQAPVQRGSNLRYWIFAGILLLVVAAIATLAFRLRDNPEDFARVTRPNPGTETAESQSGKIVERIGAGPSASSQRAPTPTPAPQPNTPRSPAPQPNAAPATQAPIVPVAHRAALLIEAPDDPQHVRTFVGTVLWRIDRSNSGPPALVADIDLPDAKFKATMRISKNTDPRLPASHTIDLRFSTAPDGEVPDVKEIDTLQMRAEDRPAGEPLSGIPAAITTNYFLIGLSGSDSAQSRNIDLLRNRGWFDVPMLLVNGKIAKITFEKGATGERMLNDVLAAWGSS